jgi:hypothetical protein
MADFVRSCLRSLPQVIVFFFFFLPAFVGAVFFRREDRKLDMRNRLVVTATVDGMSTRDDPGFLREALGLIRLKSVVRVRLGLVTIFTARFFFLGAPESVTRSPLGRRLLLDGVRRVAILPMVLFLVDPLKNSPSLFTYRPP